MTKMVWKPQTKKLAVSSQKPRCAIASASAAPIDWSLSSPARLRPASAVPSGIITNAQAPSPSSAFSQPKREISAWPHGSVTDWPKGPQEQAEALPRAQGEPEDDAAANQHHGRRAPAGTVQGRSFTSTFLRASSDA